ncbi:MAG: HDOD domain-containing protein [Acidobacteriota bacterium]
MNRLEETADAASMPAASSLDAVIEAGLMEGTLELPVLPAAATQILALTSDESVDAARLARLVQGDQTLASHVLRVANSAAFAPSSTIVSLQHAVTRLGIRTLGEIALSASVRSRLFRAPGFEGQVAELWRLALTSGVYAKEIARMRRQNVEIAFMCGLLHDVGSPLVLGILEKQCRPPAQIPGPAERVSLLERFRIRAGVLLAERWKLPPPVQTAIAFHQRYQEAVHHREEAMVTSLATRLAAWLQVDRAPEDAEDRGETSAAVLEELRQQPVLGDLNLYPDDLEDLLGQAETVLQTVQAMTP